MKTQDIIQDIKQRKDKVNYFDKFSYLTRGHIEGLLGNCKKEKKDPIKFIEDNLKDIASEKEIKAIISDLPSYKALRRK